MMHSFLTRDNETARVGNTLEIMREMNERIEMLSRQILRSVGTNEAKLTAELYDAMLSHEVVRDLSYMRSHPTPRTLLQHTDLDSCASALRIDLVVEERDESSVAASGHMSRPRYTEDSKQYLVLREKLLGILQSHGLTPEAYISSSQEAEQPPG